MKKIKIVKQGRRFGVVVDVHKPDWFEYIMY